MINFPDRNHLLQLRKELWQQPQSRASVMVGAGFSLNALPSPGLVTSFPTWRQLARDMFDEIYPPTGAPSKDREDRFNRSNPLRIASEYKAAFKRHKLESFIGSRIPDSSHQPGPLHKYLLQLPWQDVFTTNYDTLLERTEVTGRSYQPVTTVDDLTSATAPRIIKLHGTLRSDTQFIITEEDYRTYPRCFAPFVNTVRQSLIENSFVLIGFSGDDPNFLEWIGWIRDELEDLHAPIYLAGMLSLDYVQRSLLAERGVTPIDLAPMFPDSPESWEEAIEWFLQSLMMGRPSSIYKWPKRNTINKEIREYSPPLLIDGLDEPEVVSPPSSIHGLEEGTAWRVLMRWNFERTRYPGWLIPPDEMRSYLWKNTERWIGPLLEFSKNRSPVERVLIFYEIDWRLEVSMFPLFEDTKGPFEASIQDLFPNLIDGGSIQSPSTLFSDVSIEEAWLEIAFALLREAREMYDQQRWNRFKEQIDQIVPRFPRYSDRREYEHALWLMWNIRRPEAREILDKWSPSSHAPLAIVRKCGLLAELDAADEAKSLLRSALRYIRRAIQRTPGHNVHLLSLEGWCMYLLHEIVLRAEWINSYDQLSDRWHELKTWDCSPWPLLEYFENVITEDPPRRERDREVLHTFDPWQRTISHHAGRAGMTPWLPAFSCIRLYEQVGIPLSYSGKALANACGWIAPFTSFWSPALLIRAGKAADLKTFLKRPQIANINADLAKNIHRSMGDGRWAMDALKREQVNITDHVPRMSSLGALLQVLFEVLSRLTIRLDTDELDEAFSIALKTHAEPGIYSHLTLHGLCQSWFKRLFTAASDSQLSAWLPALVRFPLPDEIRRSANPHRWEDPIANFPMMRVRPDRSLSDDKDSTDSIRPAISWLLDRTKSESGEEWRRCVMRLVSLLDSNMLTESQEADVGLLLWKNTKSGKLPDLHSLYRCSYAHLPAPKNIDVVPRIKTCLLDGTPRRAVSATSDRGISIKGGIAPDEWIFDVAWASKPIIQVPGERTGCVEWTREEAKILLTRILDWWRNDKRALPGRSLFSSDVKENADNAGVFLRRAVLSRRTEDIDDEWHAILEFLEDTRRHGMYLTSALPYVLIHRATERRKIERTLIDDLSSDIDDAVSEGARALRHWIHLAADGLLEKPPDQAVKRLLHRVIFRGRVGAVVCLDQVAALVEEQSKFFERDHIDLLISCLLPWSEAISLANLQDGRGDFAEAERPELRALLGSLAGALSVWLSRNCPSQQEPYEISHLRVQYESDPLPEVRRSIKVSD